MLVIVPWVEKCTVFLSASYKIRLEVQLVCSQRYDPVSGRNTVATIEFSVLKIQFDSIRPVPKVSLGLSTLKEFR